MAHGRAGQRRVLDDGHLARELGEQPHAALEHVVEVDRALEELGDRPALGPRERLDLVQPVDEEPVALVGGDAPGAGVGLGDVALLLERRHVVAHRRARDTRGCDGRRGPSSPTGSLVATKSATIARRTATRRSSAFTASTSSRLPDVRFRPSIVGEPRRDRRGVPGRLSAKWRRRGSRSRRRPGRVVDSPATLRKPKRFRRDSEDPARIPSTLRATRATSGGAPSRAVADGPSSGGAERHVRGETRAHRGIRHRGLTPPRARSRPRRRAAAPGA